MEDHKILKEEAVGKVSGGDTFDMENVSSLTIEQLRRLQEMQAISQLTKREAGNP